MIQIARKDLAEAYHRDRWGAEAIRRAHRTTR
jgi:hypothetical protein